jgi:hypothetical protein
LVKNKLLKECYKDINSLTYTELIEELFIFQNKYNYFTNLSDERTTIVEVNELNNILYILETNIHIKEYLLSRKVLKKIIMLIPYAITQGGLKNNIIMLLRKFSCKSGIKFLSVKNETSLVKWFVEILLPKILEKDLKPAFQLRETCQEITQFRAKINKGIILEGPFGTIELCPLKTKKVKVRTNVIIEGKIRESKIIEAYEDMNEIDEAQLKLSITANFLSFPGFCIAYYFASHKKIGDFQ